MKKWKKRKKLLIHSELKKEKLTNVYLKSDIYLLTCVFEKFEKVSVNEFDIAHYIV